MTNPIDFISDAALLGLHNSTEPQQSRLRYWWTCHLRAFLFACGELIRHPFSNVMTLLVIGIAFSLPVTFFALLQNVEGIVSSWQSSPKIILYLKQGATPTQVDHVIQSLNQNEHIENVRYISPQQGLQALQQSGGIDNQSLQSLGVNPLPGVIEVTPNHINSTPQSIQQLYNTLQDSDSVELVQLNLNWVKRLYSLIDTLQYLTLAITVLFAIGLVLIVGNSIRLDMKSHQQQIDILRLIGATKSFIRRPLLYKALLYGCFGGLVAWGLCALFLWWMQAPASQLALSYNSALNLRGLSFTQGLIVIIMGSVLSYGSARGVVNYCLFRERTLV